MELTESLLAKMAGWEAMKQARAIVAEGRAFDVTWSSPLLLGMVRAGEIRYKAGLRLRSERDVENLCTCRVSRQWGTLCAHSVAVALQFLKGPSESAATGTTSGPEPASKETSQTSAVRLPRATSGHEGTLLQLHVVFPPNLEATLTRGRIQLCLEASWLGRRAPLNTVPLDREYWLDAVDSGLLDWIEAQSGGRLPAVLTLTTTELGSLLPRLAGAARITAGRSQTVQVLGEPWYPPILAKLEAHGEILLQRRGGAGEARISVGSGWVYGANEFQPLGLPKHWAPVLQGPVRLKREEVPSLLGREWSALTAAEVLESDFRPEDFEMIAAPLRIGLRLEGGMAVLDAKLEAQYGERTVNLGLAGSAPGASGSAGVEWMPDPDHPRRYQCRDRAGEGAAVARLGRCGFTGPDRQGFWRLTGQESVLRFLARELPRWREEWTVVLGERLERSTERHVERIEPRFTITGSGTDWFEMRLEYQSASGDALSPAEVQRLLRSGQGHVRLPSGKAGLLDIESVEELGEVLRDCAPQQAAGVFRIAKTQAAFLEGSLAEHGWKSMASADWRQAVGQQLQGAGSPCPALGQLETVLRPYQKAGVAWFHFLAEHGFGGILADDMGLGKTLQALAFLWTRAQRSSSLPPEDRRLSLVVCPASLVSNWVSEAARYTPELRVLAMVGAERSAHFVRLKEWDLVVTSYGLVARDRNHYDGLEFDTIFLDEAQHIKNRQTQNAQAVKALRARHRYALSGTPLENSVLDLWSLFDFLMPGYLGGAREFRERYELPISRDRCKRTQSRLARRVRPFVLRRLKREVARELPERLEQLVYCELSPEQSRVYRQLLEAGRQEMVAAGASETQARARMIALNTLLRLRQVCCDLRLIQPESNAEASVSGKRALFEELLEEVLDGGHRVLVFSQFTSLLALVRQDLDSRSIGYCYLDGSTRDRAGEVMRFQSQEHVPVFLISLKAGGVGLNLTAADTVFHLDPWWNPAVTAQATDRAHRIGQTRVVTSYQLITRGTVEEKILELQRRKRAVVAGVVGDETGGAALGWEEIQELLLRD